MNNKDSKIEFYRSLKGSNYAILERLVLDQKVPDERNPYESSLVLTLRNRSNSDASRLVLSFSKVRNFKLNPENMEISFSLLSIMPENNEWEDVNFKVFNDEQDVEFSFFCDDFTVTLT